MILALLIWIVTISIDLVTDVHLHDQGKQVNHARGAILRCIGLIPAVWLAGWFGPVLMFLYWCAFDLLYNALTGQKLLRRGTTAFLDRLPWWVEWACLIGAIVLWWVKK